MFKGFHTFFAPGRVNLIGEHTDYNGGHVFPCALTIGTYMFVKKRDDRKLRFYSVNKTREGVVESCLNDMKEGKKTNTWADYPLGVMYTLTKNGYPVETGLTMIFYGNLPTGAGLSSSASMEVVTAFMLKALFSFLVDEKELAKLCQWSENHFNGVKCGIMDQFASAMGKQDQAMFLDTHTMEFSYVKLPMEGMRLVVADTNQPHDLVTSAYNERREECERALQEIRKEVAVDHLCDLTPEKFEQVQEMIEDPVTRKRARHVIFENARTKEAVKVLQEGNLKRWGELLKEAHLSMKEDYEATGKALDTLAEEAWKYPGCIGSRMTGGGFGGCTVSFVEKDRVQDFICQVGEAYEKRTGLKADFYEMEIGGGPLKEEDGHSFKLGKNEQLVEWAVSMLTAYGLLTGLIGEEDIIYTLNSLLMILKLDAYHGEAERIKDAIEVWKQMFEKPEDGLCGILALLCEAAYDHGVIEENSVVYRDLFDTRLMGALTPRPSEVIHTFHELYEDSPGKATDWYYQFSQDTNYIRRDRIANDEKWKVMTDYGEMDMTINLSKPEKDPKAIAAAGKLKPAGYPKCLLCKENEGYAGRVNHPARENHRIIPVTIQNRQWGLQYSPYVYYPEHCIVFSFCHEPMQINHDTFVKLFDFVKAFPHYFVGSNADLPIVGGSILSHDHFQGGHYTFSMEKASVEKQFEINGFQEVEAGIVKWPMSVIRLAAKDSRRVIAAADKILTSWRAYSDEEVMICASTNGTMHNTITPIARMRGEKYELDLVLRNNLTTKERPMGLFHPNPSLHHIKKENIGLIEVMGLAVLPARLKQEMEAIKRIMVEEIAAAGEVNKVDEATDKMTDLFKDKVVSRIAKRIAENEAIEKHADWVREFLPKYSLASTNEEKLSGMLQEEIGKVFEQVLLDAGVFKRDEQGQEAFTRFIRQIG